MARFDRFVKRHALKILEGMKAHRAAGGTAGIAAAFRVGQFSII
jgi:hypothetical protein